MTYYNYIQKVKGSGIKLMILLFVFLFVPGVYITYQGAKIPESSKDKQGKVVSNKGKKYAALGFGLVLMLIWIVYTYFYLRTFD